MGVVTTKKQPKSVKRTPQIEKFKKSPSAPVIKLEKPIKSEKKERGNSAVAKRSTVKPPVANPETASLSGDKKKRVAIKKEGHKGLNIKQETNVVKVEPTGKTVESGKSEDKPKVSDQTDLVEPDVLLKGVDAVFKAAKAETSEKKNILDNDFKYVLQITARRIGKCAQRLGKIYLPHPLSNESSEICLFVKDLVRGRKVDYQPTIDAAEELLAKHNVTGITRIIPMNQLITEYQQFEKRRGLANSFDFFLSDARICKHVFSALGQSFVRTRKSPIAVRMDGTEVKREFERSLHKVSYLQSMAGASTTIPIGTNTMSEQQIAENVKNVLNQLRTKYVGGWDNIKNVYLKLSNMSKIAVPLFVNMQFVDPSEPLPQLIGPQEAGKLKRKRKIASTMDGIDVLGSGEQPTEAKRAKKVPTNKKAKKTPKVTTKKVKTPVITDEDKDDDGELSFEEAEPIDIDEKFMKTAIKSEQLKSKKTKINKIKKVVAKPGGPKLKIAPIAKKSAKPNGTAKASPKSNVILNKKQVVVESSKTAKATKKKTKNTKTIDK